MDGYKGKVVFSKDIKMGFVNVWHGICADRVLNGKMQDEVVLGVTEVEVIFVDSRSQEIELIQKNIEAERAASQMRINTMLGKIQELQAISHDAN